MSQALKKHYEKLYQTYGRDHNAVQYSSKASQIERFKVLLGIHGEINSIADIGCGLGDLLPLFRERFPNSKYDGYDFVNAFVDDASQRFASDKRASFKQLDILQNDIHETADYVVLSGMLNNAINPSDSNGLTNQEFTHVSLQKMWQAASKGIAFNALSSYVDYQDEGLYYQDPLALFDYCKRHLSKYVCLRHDYDVKANSIPFEFTIYVYKK